MPITAALSDGSRVKARTWEIDEWREMVGSKSRPDLWCPFCEGPMHPKTSTAGLQFFAHNPGGPDCRFNVGNGAESATHMRLKDYITAAIDNVAGWEGMPEHRVDVDGRHYVADVYARRTDDKPATPGVYEVQLSHQGDGEVIERQSIRNASGAVTTWVTKVAVPWFRRVPTLQIATTDTGRVQIIDGLMVTDTEKAKATMLERFIARRLAGDYAFVENVGIIRKGGWVAPAEPTPKVAGWTPRVGGSDECHRTPVLPVEARPAPTLPPTAWTMNIAPERLAVEGEQECGWLGCPAPAERVLTFPSGADWTPHACARHAEALAERYGAAVGVLA